MRIGNIIYYMYVQYEMLNVKALLGVSKQKMPFFHKVFFWNLLRRTNFPILLPSLNSHNIFVRNPLVTKNIPYKLS